MYFHLQCILENIAVESKSFKIADGEYEASALLLLSKTNLDWLGLVWGVLFSAAITKIKEISKDYYFPSRHTLCTSYLGRLLGFVIGGINLNRSTSSVHSQPTANFLCYVLLSESAQYLGWSTCPLLNPQKCGQILKTNLRQSNEHKSETTKWRQIWDQMLKQI